MTKGEMPPKEYFDHSMVEYFALMLLCEAVTRFMTRENIDTVEKEPLFEQIPEMEARRNQIDKDWRDKEVYFYPGGGSPFMDYKIARGNYFAPDGSLSRWIRTNMSLATTTKQAYEIIYKQVSGWWD